MVRKSFKRELFLGLFLVSLIPGLVVSLLLVRTFRSRLASDYHNTATSQVAVVTETLEQYFDSIEETQNLIIKNKKIIQGISETDSWYYSGDDGVDLEGRPLTEEDITGAMIRVVRDEDECWESLGNVLFALTKALEAVKDGKVIYAVLG